MEKADFKDHIGYPLISLTTFKLYLGSLTKRTENNAVAIAEPNFRDFYRQTTVEARYFAELDTYSSANCNGFKFVLLATSPMEGETTQTVDQHIGFSSHTIGAFEKNFDKVTTLIADNSSTNRNIATKMPTLDRLLVAPLSICHSWDQI